MLSRQEAKKLDKFYTKEEVALSVIRKTKEVLSLGSDTKCLEPSAGSGNFSKNLSNCLAYDIHPEDENIIEQDFLELVLDDKDYITIGNPPYGNRNDLAIQFVNHASKFSEAISFVIPITFLKWSVQKNIIQDLKLVYSEVLEEDSFTFMDSDYSVRTCLQIWVRKDVEKYKELEDIRLTGAPPTSLPDFQIWQHNATDQSRPYVDEDWKYASWRQGYKNYNQLFEKSKDYQEVKKIVYETNLQLFYFNPLSTEAEKVYLAMDLDKLSRRNMSTPGFGKGDFVQFYLETKARLKEEGLL